MSVINAAASILSDRDVNATMTAAPAVENVKEVKSMEFHRQVLQNKMKEEKAAQYISPSDEIMSPCTAKLTAFRGKQAGKIKPKSLFARASAKKLEGGGLLGGQSISSASSTSGSS